MINLEAIDQLLQKHLESIKVELELVRKENATFHAKVCALEEENRTLHDRIGSLEQYSRRNNVVISGIPEVEGERPLDTVNRISQTFNIDIKYGDINACHYLPSVRQE